MGRKNVAKARVAREVRSAIEHMFKDKSEDYRIPLEELLACGLMRDAFSAAGTDATDPATRAIVQSLIRASPLAEEACGYVWAVPRSARVAAVRAAVAKAFKDGVSCPRELPGAGSGFSAGDLLRLPAVGAITAEGGLVAEAALSLPFLLSSAPRAGAGPPAFRLAPRAYVIRCKAERLVCMSDAEAAGPATHAARSLRRLAETTEHGCIPAAVLCVAPGLREMAVTPQELAASLTQVVVPAASDDDEPEPLRPSSLLAPVHVGVGFDGVEEIGIAPLAHCDALGRVTSAALGPAASAEDETAIQSSADDDESGETVGRVAGALSFHLHPARLRYDVALAEAITSQQGVLRFEQLAALPRVAQQTGQADAEAALRLVAEAVRACPMLCLSRRVPAEPAAEGDDATDEPSPSGPAEPAGEARALVTETAEQGTAFMTSSVPQNRRWVTAPAAGRPAAAGEPSEAASPSAAGAAAACSSASAPGAPSGGNGMSTGHAPDDPPDVREVSNVGNDDSSFLAFWRHAGDGAAARQDEAGDGAAARQDEAGDGATGSRDEAGDGAAGTRDKAGDGAGDGDASTSGSDDEWEEGAGLAGWEAAMALDAFRAALLRAPEPGTERDAVLARARSSRVAALADATGGRTPFQAAEDQAAGRFSAMSFNVLADAYAVPENYTSSPPLALRWGWRRSLIVAEVLFRRPSVLSMQEVESWQQPPRDGIQLPSVDAGGAAAASAGASAGPEADAPAPRWQQHAAARSAAPRWGGPADNKHEWFARTLRKHGYGSHYARKTKAGDRPMSGHTIGNALFWREDEFHCESTHSLSLADEAMRLYEGGDRVWGRGFPQVAAVAHLKHRATGTSLLAASVHLSSDYTQPHIQALQALAFRMGLYRLSWETGASAVVASGDFNDSPGGAVSTAMRFARVSRTHARAALNAGAGTVPPALVVSDELAAVPGTTKAALPEMVSATLSAIGSELPFTVASPDFANTLDYIYVQARSCVADAALDGLPWAAAAAAPAKGDGPVPVSLPNVEFPSDHLPVAAVLRFCGEGEGMAAARLARSRRQ